MSAAIAQPFRVVVAGGGVAGLEAGLALHELAGERVSITLLAPEPEFVYRPMRVLEPFAEIAAHRYRLERVAADIGAEFVHDAFRWLDRDRRVVHTEAGQELPYDALLLAVGATPRARFKHAITLDDARLDEQLHGVIEDVEEGYVHRLAFLSPSQMPWPLPLYELALMTARRATAIGQDVSVTIVTPEDAPLAVFGGAVSAAVAALFEQNGILVITSTHPETPAPGRVRLKPGGRSLYPERIVALPELFGPSTPGVPKHDAHGFITVDVHCRVPGAERVFAAGDATAFPLKFGGVAAQQADVAAEAIASLAGARLKPSTFRPEIHGILLGAEKPLYLSAHITGGHGSSSKISDEPTWSPVSKIAARYLAPYLDALDRAAVR